MCADQFSPGLSRVLGSEARCDLLAILAENPDEWLTAAELCERAGVSRSGFHRDHKSLLLGFDILARRDESADGHTFPTYRLTDTEQADLLVELHDVLETKLENTDSLLADTLTGFVQ
ncbi:hypothetical protein [Haladaptatus sp.]|uniref:hypothetical protein n=1 Tax=Haladaptatus sp. TaxID=1973141 RepID=UPI003C44C91F